MRWIARRIGCLPSSILGLGLKNPISLDSRFKPYGTVYTQVGNGRLHTAMGFADPLLFYSSVKDGQFVEWGMRVVTATSDPKRDDVQIVGPELNGNPEMVPATGTIVVGDSTATVATRSRHCSSIARPSPFYSVDPKTPYITQTTPSSYRISLCSPVRWRWPPDASAI